MESSLEAAAGLDQARQAALDHWRTYHRDEASEEPSAVAEAAMHAVVLDTEQGPRFDDMAFGELVEFVAALPF